MEKRPFDLAVLQQEHVHLIIASYDGDVDGVIDRVNADAELDKKILITNADYEDANGGYRETSGSTGIASVGAVGAVITITMLGAWEAAGPTKKILPIVYYKGQAVPIVGTGGVNGITGWNGLVAGKTIVVDNTAGKYGTTITDWEVTLMGDIVGQLESIDAGGVSLPYTTNNFRSLGYREPTAVQTIQEGKQVTGSFTFWEAVNMFKNGATVHNTPGEDVEAAIFGSQWSAGAQNEITYNQKPFAISILEFTGTALNSATKIGSVFAVEQRIYGCTLNNIPNPANRGQGSTEPIKKQFDFTSKFGVYRKVHLTTAV